MTAHPEATPSWPVQRRRERTARRDRANQRVITQASRRDDPAPERAATTTFVLGAIALSFALHGAIALVARIFPENARAKQRSFQEAVKVRIAEPPKPAAPPPEGPREKPLEPTPTPTVSPKIVEAPKDEPPKDPTDFHEPTPTPDPPKDEPRRRVIGLNLESTTTAGDGPAFATGNTRMGETGRVAEDPKAAGKLGSSFVPPKRTTAPKPVYPPALRAANVEGDVGLKVDIDASGAVTNVAITSGSGHADMDRAAVDAARASRYEPAKLNGVAVAHAIDFTVRFRVER